MRQRSTIVAALAVGTLVLALGPRFAAATDANLKCQKGIGAKAKKFVHQRLKLEEDCRLDTITTPGDCPAPDPTKMAKLEAKLRADLAKQCSAADLAALGFPGACMDMTGGSFTLPDLQDCIFDSHDAAVTSLRDIEGDPDLTPGSFDAATLACQKEIFKRGLRFLDAVLKNVQRCRNDIIAGKLTGIDPNTCATADPKAATAIAKARSKAKCKIVDRCSDVQVMALEVCEPVDQTTAPAAADCILEGKLAAADEPSPPGLVQYEYPPRPTPTPTATPQPAICGDNLMNRAAEECDGTDDAACPGQCGAAGVFFECLCLDAKRERVVEHAGADLDIGWKGLSHDSDIVEGGGYTADLWDCDGPSGPDTLCTVGPSCSLAPHSPCSATKNGPVANVGPPYEDGDAICSGLGQGTCRKTLAGANGPHCEIQFKKECDNDGQCTTPGDHCVKVLHGAPLPLSAGSVTVCIHNIFTEDVVGTDDVASGAGAVRVRQLSKTFLGGDPAEPCPVCGGFCSSGTASATSPGGRLPCVTNADCTDPPNVCVTNPVCSYGQNKDQPCRPNPPFGGPTVLFGNPSIDCPVAPAATVLGQPNVLFNPATTDTVSLTATLQCTDPGYNGKACFQGTDAGRPCTMASECPGGACQHQCYCPAEAKPNDCLPACLGGANDDAACETDSECPGGFCHNGDCHLNPADTDSVEEGVCTAGPIDLHCSLATYHQCNVDADCQPSIFCPRCQAGEQCIGTIRECFLNPLVRSGAAGVPDRVGAAVFCVAATGSGAVDGTAGLAGPGALTQPETTLYSGF